MDSLPDLVVANLFTNDLSILLRNGNSFVAADSVFTGSFQPRSVAVADFNQDGTDDLVVGHESTIVVSILLGQGDGTFGAPITLNMGGGQTTVSTGLFTTGDVFPDIAVTSAVSNQAFVISNTTGTNFSVLHTVSTGAIPSRAEFANLEAISLNPDNNPDLIVSSFGANRVETFFNSGTGSLSAAFNTDVGLSPSDIAVADFDLDGSLDVATANQFSDNVTVLFNNGFNGQFDAARTVSYPAGSGPTAIEAVDMNVDGLVDLVVTNGSDSNLAVLFNLGGGVFQSPQNFGVGIFPVRLAWSVATADFDQDGDPDLAVAKGVSNQAAILENTLTEGVYRVILSGDGDETVSNLNFIVQEIQPEFVITESGGTTVVSEDGETDSFDVVLTLQPASDVVLTVTSANPSEATVDQPTLTFTTSNWDTPQTVTVSAVDDEAQDGDLSVSVTVSVDDANSDDDYDPLSDQTVNVTTIDKIDTVNPTVTVNIVDASLSDGDNSSDVTFEFSEDVNGFDASDVTVSGGAFSNFMAVDGDSFTATFTADDGIETTGSVSVGAGYTDTAGNTGAVGSDTVAIDTVDRVVVQFDLRVVTQPTALASNGEAAVLPPNEAAIHEWESFDVEIWVSTPGVSSEQISSADVDLAYNTQLFTATAIEFSPGFLADAVPVIDDSAGTVTGIVGTVVATGVADDQFALLARVRFESRPGDQLAIDFDNELIGPASLGLSLPSVEVELPEMGTVASQIGPLPTTEVFAVIYDIDDSGGVSFGDLSPFADAFGDDVATSDSEFAWIADFDKSGRVGFGDLSSFADAFGKTQASPDALAFPDNFPDAWRSSALVTASLPRSTGAESLTDSVALDSATVLDFLSIARESFVSAGAPDAVIPRLEDIDIQIVDLPGRYLGLTSGNRILIDANAAGHGWYIDPTPLDDSEFGGGGDRPDGIDLLTVIC